MPFLPIFPPDLHYTIFIGQCSRPDALTYIKYAVVSIRGNISLGEANNFLVAFLDSPRLPRYEPFFASRPLSLHTMFYDAFPHNPTAGLMRYYMDQYSVLEYISLYEWQVSRHDLHANVKSPANNLRNRGVIFGSTPADPEDD